MSESGAGQARPRPATPPPPLRRAPTELGSDDTARSGGSAASPGRAYAGTGGYGVGRNYGGSSGGNPNPRHMGANPPEHVVHGRRGSGVYASLDQVRWTMGGEGVAR